MKFQGYSLSDEFNDFLVKRTAELRGTAEPNSPNSLEKEKHLADERDRYVVLVEKKVNRLKQHPDFERANKLLGDLGLLKDLRNAAEITPLFHSKWDGTDEDFNVEYVELIKASAKKHELTRKLKELQAVHHVSESGKATEQEPSTTVSEIPPTDLIKPKED